MEAAPIIIRISHEVLIEEGLNIDLVRELGFHAGVSRMNISKDFEKGISEFEFDNLGMMLRFMSLIRTVRYI